MIEIKEPLFHNCCVACGVGRGDNTRELIIAQYEKHGEFICEPCENFFETWLRSEEELTYNGLETFVTPEAIYHKDHGRPLVCDPKSAFLGFGGAWILISKRYKHKYGTSVKHFVANNLFHDRRIPESYRQKLIHFQKIDSEIQFTNLENLKELRDQLNKLPYLKEGAK
ncbi:hypothetical protein [Planomicrobium sp. MB-3u-38]|uniref:hypothetical protein n=1 Tax=Planomicrobium sp. MB-3u-38 TaxID=2058318 RepID=UPI000C7AE934|nr:hypothetical protein [Planomicrobium sp. MB-3u-38]PKH09835.1 hypothetical protein CXF70_11505 [Planomicrobium sp. MB-3u-38]